MNGTIILVGGGHVHLEVLRRWIDRPMRGHRIILISPSPHQYYSGMFAAYVEGLEAAEAIRVDLPALCARASCQWVQAAVTRIDADDKRIYTSSGEMIPYDCLSINIGSTTNSSGIPGVETYAQLIKPNFQLPAVVDALQHDRHIVVVGGGASGVELSAAIAASRRHRGWSDPAVTLVHRGQLLADYPQRVGTKIAEILQNKGVSLIGEDAIVAIQAEAIRLGSGRQIGYDSLLWLTGPAAPPLFRVSGLLVDERGYLLVNDAMQVEHYPMIFGAGDCVTMTSAPWMHKAGVYAVRQADILSDNLHRFVSGKPLRYYKPQQNYLAILSTGDREALLLYRGLAVHAAWCWQLKRWIDKRFIRRYQMESHSQHMGGNEG